MYRMITGAAIAFALTAPATAATIRYDIEFETTVGSPASYQPYVFELPRFDASLGTLKRVELFWTADAFLGLTWTTTTNPLTDVYGAWAPHREVYVDLQPQVFGVGLSFITVEGIAVGRVPAGHSGDLTASAHAAGYAINDAFSQDLTPYSTSDRIRLAYSELFYGLSEAGGDMDLVVAAVAKHKFSYVYTYLPGIPEPATWAMMVLGFGAGGAALRGRRRRAALHPVS